MAEPSPSTVRQTNEWGVTLRQPTSCRPCSKGIISSNSFTSYISCRNFSSLHFQNDERMAHREEVWWWCLITCMDGAAIFKKCPSSGHGSALSCCNHSQGRQHCPQKSTCMDRRILCHRSATAVAWFGYSSLFRLSLLTSDMGAQEGQPHMASGSGFLQPF